MILSIITTLITLAILAFYQLRRINTFQLTIIAWATSSYYLSIGPTWNVFFFLTTYVGFVELYFIISNRCEIRFNTLFILAIPIISSLLFFISYVSLPIEYEVTRGFELFINPIYFYFKYYLPYFLIGHRIYRESKDSSYWQLSIKWVKKILMYSCIIASFQFVLYPFIQESILVDIVGLKARYAYSIGFIDSIRLNAFFAEPKDLAVLLGVGSVLLFENTEFRKLIWTFLLGILTLSNTYFAIVLVYVFLRISMIFIKEFKLIVILSLLLTIIFFTGVSEAKSFLFENYKELKKYQLAEILFERALSRYDENNAMAAKEFFGIPMQADLEAPFIGYFDDFPILFFIGHGVGNSTFVPNRYFYGTWAYKNRLEGNRRWHINMGWFYWIFQIGLIGTFAMFWLITSRINPLNKKTRFLAFLLCVLFFCRVEVLLALFIPIYHKSKHKIDNSF